MDSQTKEVRNAYMREWRARNKDKVKAHQEKYWSNKAERIMNREKKGSEK